MIWKMALGVRVCLNWLEGGYLKMFLDALWEGFGKALWPSTGRDSASDRRLQHCWSEFFGGTFGAIPVTHDGPVQFEQVRSKETSKSLWTDL